MCLNMACVCRSITYAETASKAQTRFLQTRILSKCVHQSLISQEKKQNKTMKRVLSSECVLLDEEEPDGKRTAESSDLVLGLASSSHLQRVGTSSYGQEVMCCCSAVRHKTSAG